MQRYNHQNVQMFKGYYAIAINFFNDFPYLWNEIIKYKYQLTFGFVITEIKEEFNNHFCKYFRNIQ